LGKEADSRRVLMHNVTGMDFTVNQGWDEHFKDNNENIMGVMKRYHDLYP
jgi:hypothetical protein